jgi:GNAT superfamily N-acetyltransferase
MGTKEYYIDTSCDDISHFDSGYAVFNDYLKYRDDSAVVHYVFDAETDKLVAYFSLIASALLEGDPAKLYAIPAIELKMFAIDKSCKGTGLSSFFLDGTVETIKYYSREYIGAEVIFLYSVPYDYVVQLYESKGFIRIDDTLTAFKSDFTEGCVPMFMAI